jgi:hypothetical protein
MNPELTVDFAFPGSWEREPESDTPIEDASKSPTGDAVLSHWRCIISFRDAHPPHLHPHFQIAGYVTLLAMRVKFLFALFFLESFIS